MSSNPTQTTTDRIDVEQSPDPGTWDAFVRRSDGPPFALSGWSDAASVYGHDAYTFIVTDAEGIVAGLGLVHVQSRLFGSKLVSPPFAARGSVVAADRATEAHERALLERTRALADALGVEFVSLRGRELATPASFDSRRRFVTFRIPVADEETMRSNLKDSRDRQIRQAADHDRLSYSEGDSLADLREYFQLYLRSVRGHGTPPHAFEFYERLWRAFDAAGDIQLAFVRRDGEPINGIINFAVGSTVYQWGVVSDYDYRELNGGSLLVWKSLQWAADRGCDSYELGRTREGSGVYMFKKSFGGEKTWYDDCHYFPGDDATLPNPEDETYDQLKAVWRRLPIPLTRLVGPTLRQSITL